ncbi:MAG: DUF302 domain-containing protein [Gammaproteobacteria bacterium]
MKKLLISLLLSIGLVASANAADKGKGMEMSKEMMQAMVAQSMTITPAADDISFEDVVDSMKLRANSLNFKLVAELPLSEQVKAMGQESIRMEIYAFCDALIAKHMVEYNLVFAGYLPCRIAVVEDKETGRPMLITMNMDMMVNAVDLPPELQKMANTVRDNINSIVDAGANGDL